MGGGNSGAKEWQMGGGNSGAKKRKGLKNGKWVEGMLALDGHNLVDGRGDITASGRTQKRAKPCGGEG